MRFWKGAWVLVVALAANLGGCAAPALAPESECLAPGRVDSWKTVAWLGAPAASATVLDARTESALEAALVEAARPAQVTLVPDGDGQLTSDHGWAMTDEDLTTLKPLVARFKALGARVSLFMDPNPEAIARVPETGADRIELYTEPFAEAFKADGRRWGAATEASLATFRAAAETAQGLGLGVNAGHDLDLDNLIPLRTLPGLQEVSIGHALVADALLFGFHGAVTRYRDTLAGA